MITSLSERFRGFALLVQMKKVISMSYDSSTSSWKPWRWLRLALILSMRDIYINSNLNPLTKFTSSSRSTSFKDILPWGIFQIIPKTVPINMRILISNAMKWGIPLCILNLKLITKNLYGPFLWMGFNCLKVTATSRTQFTFYHQVPRNSWYLFYHPQKDERLSQSWSHPVVLNTVLLDWESTGLTTRPLLHKYQE